MLMKEGLGSAAINRIACALEAVMSDFDRRTFEREAARGLDELELKQRVQHLIRVLHQHLPANFPDCARLLAKLPEVWDYGQADDPLRGFAAWPLIDYVAEYGLSAPKSALRALEKLTPMFSAEFAIRPFIQSHPELTASFLQEWLTHPSEHVRRLVSEGSRPRLPWGKRLARHIDNPALVIPLLESLRFDSSQYVRRSVANSLNDIGKDHPEVLIEVCLRWRESDQGKTDWIIKHATRSLVKAGHPASFPLLGYTAKPKVELLEFSLARDELELGEVMPVSVQLKGLKAGQKLVLDYAVHYQKAKGKQSSKVFKWKNLELARDESVCLSKHIPFKPISTRTYYAGEHHIALHVNGVELVRKPFWLKV